jgi:hypothetical protein
MTVPPNLLRMIRDRILNGRYKTGAHAIRHGVEQGFVVRDALTAVREGHIIENYPERGRCLICARISASSGRQLWLHVVCDYNDRETVGITTAYVPDPNEWGDPPIRRVPTT